MFEPINITVRSIPERGHDSRWRAKRKWGKNPVAVRVVVKPDLKATSPIEISPSDYAMLRDDPLMVAMPVGGGDPQVPEMVAALVEANDKIAELRQELSDHMEQADLERGAMSRVGEETAARLVAIEGENEKLKAQLAKKLKKASEE